MLIEYDWPGNVRELENAVERAVVLTKSRMIDLEDLPREILGARATLGGRSLSIEIGTPLEEIERRVIHETLKQTKGDKRVAAQLLGIATRTIYHKLDRELSQGEGAGEGGTGEELAGEDEPETAGETGMSVCPVGGRESGVT